MNLFGAVLRQKNRKNKNMLIAFFVSKMYCYIQVNTALVRLYCKKILF